MTGTLPLRAALAGEDPVVGSWLSLASPAVAEVLSYCGFTWLLVDQQHSAVGMDGLVGMVRAVEAGGAAAVVRVPGNRPEYIASALDTGAQAVMVPLVSTAADAEHAVQSTRYPPRGWRSIGGYRAAMAARLTRDEYYRRASERVSTWIQIEDIAAVEHIDEILHVDGVDVFFVGPQDLAASLGLVPALEPEDETFEAALDVIVRAAQRTGATLGLLVPTTESALRRIAQGFRVVAMSTDAAMLAAAGRKARALATE